MEILISYGGVEKSVSIARNATIFKLRKQLMNLYSIKWNFVLYNVEMKR